MEVVLTQTVVFRITVNYCYVVLVRQGIKIQGVRQTGKTAKVGGVYS